jgi:hypothetical protein
VVVGSAGEVDGGEGGTVPSKKCELCQQRTMPVHPVRKLADLNSNRPVQPRGTTPRDPGSAPTAMTTSTPGGTVASAIMPLVGWWRPPDPVFLHPGAGHHEGPSVEVTTDKAAVYPHVLDELASGPWHCAELYTTDESRSRAAEAAPAADARPENGSRSQNHHRRDTRSSRTSAAATTNSALTKQ